MQLNSVTEKGGTLSKLWSVLDNPSHLLALDSHRKSFLPVTIKLYDTRTIFKVYYHVYSTYTLKLDEIIILKAKQVQKTRVFTTTALFFIHIDTSG